MKTQAQAVKSRRGGRWREDWSAGFIGETSDDSSYRYRGPTVQVSFDETFVIVETDPYEGSAMFRRENLPDVIAMLREVAAEIKRVPPAPRDPEAR